ncbi:metal ABC transporter solute-binding protein, Zn/Mn family [Bacillus sp. 1P02SD]|uniref:metal ABC transporter solute-binding protein, Zn/Mn family n=1 Tax=Bacillus sp. 1P02SD TaxID=3132264 RepID=UPI0039A26688
MVTYKVPSTSNHVSSSNCAGCNSENKTTETTNNSEDILNQEETKLKIYTTLFPLKDFAEKIGGKYVEVESILPPGSDAHTYEPTTKQMINIGEAHAFIYNGLGMETYAEKIAEALKDEETLMVEAAHGIKTIKHSHGHEDENHEGEEHAHEDEHHEGEEHSHEGEHHEGEEHSHEGEHHEGEEHSHEDEHHEGEEHSHEDEHGHHHHGDYDPHVWLDPHRAITLAENTKDALIKLKPDAAEEFESNFSTLKSELEKLDEEFHQLAESKENPEMIVSHAAYGYWEESFGIHQIAVAGLSPTNEPSQKELEKIIDIAKDKQIKYVIFEQNVTPKVAEVIRQEIKAEPLYLHNLSVLTDEDIANGEDYLNLMRKNIEALDIALK